MVLVITASLRGGGDNTLLHKDKDLSTSRRYCPKRRSEIPGTLKNAIWGHKYHQNHWNTVTSKNEANICNNSEFDYSYCNV